jgi:hypothetical protein
LVKDILAKTKNRVKVVHVKPYWYFELPVYAEIKVQMRNIYLYKYRKELSGFDAIVSTLYNDLFIKKIISEKIKLVYSGHGVSNSEYSFDNDIIGFDFVLISGEAEFYERIKRKQISKYNSAVIGYPKIDVIPETTNSIFQNNNKTFLYNPHWRKEYTSYYKYGIEILSFFKSHPEYNLIFAPHSLLKERYFNLNLEVRKFKNVDNILIDLGSENANNMTYTKDADIYIGDYSSQALEFVLLKQRPCIFIDPENNESSENALSWRMGKVYKNFSMDVLENAINEAEKLFREKYKAEQLNLISKLFTISKEKTSSEAAALAIYTFLNSM